MTDYKKYSLGQVENFLYDAMSTEATPQEIYDVIKGVVQDNYYTYKQQTSKAYELLALLNGNGEGHITGWEESSQYTEEEMDAMCAAAEAKDKVVKWSLPVEIDGPSGEYFITFPDDLLEAADLKEGDQVEWIDQGDGSYLMKNVEKKEHPSWVRGNELSRVKTYQEMIDDGWEMTDDGFWIKEN
jgi:bifunctional DNA-binding transcriptional regulator/antitoxin component of YhaV-PrlF toxin-antitoxin module